ncbi:MAG: molybdenum cofactor guanylyltransferase MobA [Rhodospirillales bacterium]|nr:molybdenum cofactor guanylyltransferase MobA [Rhodospirillales bacterium]
MSGAPRTPSKRVYGVLLAGGRSRRLGGGDKCLRSLGGRPIIAHVIERAQGQVADLILNANGDADRFARFPIAVVPDIIGDFAGPLAGVLTGLEWAREHAAGAEWVASFATDAPFLPRDLVARLLAAVGEDGAEIACATSAGRAHPVFAVWPVRLADALRSAIADEGLRKIDLWTARFRTTRVEFASVPVDPFFNVNTPDDLAEAERLADSVDRS